LRLPGQFLEERPACNLDTLVGKLSRTMQQLRPKIRRHGTRPTFVFKDMADTPKMFVRQDMPTGTLQPPYEGPYEVLSRGEKTYKLKIRGRTVRVSTDRLKPAYILAEEEEEKTSLKPVLEEEKPTTTASGRRIKPPVRFKL